MDDATDTVHIIQTKEQLLRDISDNWDWNASIIVLFNQREQVLAKYLKRHYKVLTIKSMMEELIKHLQIVCMVSCWFQSLILVIFL